MVIQHNICAMNANRILKNATVVQSGITQKLSSGYCINRAADDAAGLSISEKMRKQIRGLKQGIDNIQDGISLLQVADGALEEVQDMLHRMNELAVQSANGTNSETDRMAIQQEVNQLRVEIDRIGETTTFNERKIFQNSNVNSKGNGTGSNTFSLHVTGMPTDISIKDYTISADATNGITVNATTISWANIQNASGNTLATQSQSGEYHFTYNGLDFSFQVKAGDTLETLIKEIDGLEFAIDKKIPNGKVTSVSFSQNPNKSVLYVYDGDTYADINKNGNCEITANDAGITITNKNNGSSTYIDFYNDADINGNVYDDLFTDGTANRIDFCLYDTPYILSVDLQSGWTKQDVIDAINGATYRSNTTASIGEPVVTVNPGLKNGFDISLYGTISNFGLNFFQKYGLDITELDRYVNGFTGGFEQNASGGYQMFLEKNGQKSIFEMVGAISNNVAAGDMETIKFEDADGNYISFILKANANITSNNFHKYLNAGTNYITEFIGHSLYQDSNFQMAQAKPCDITVSKNANAGIAELFAESGIRIQCSGETSDYVFIHVGSMSAKKLGIEKLSVETEESSTKAIDLVAKAIEQISAQRSGIGAYQNRLEHAAKINGNVLENTQYAESMIRDTDMAKYMVLFSNHQILLSAGQSMLSSANQNREAVLKLLR